LVIVDLKFDTVYLFYHFCNRLIANLISVPVAEFLSLRDNFEFLHMHSNILRCSVSAREHLGLSVFLTEEQLLGEKHHPHFATIKEEV
jgi:hypothetical protein